MDALKFIQERQRMCDSYNDDCMGCLMCGQYCGIDKGVDAERLVEVVELWSKENPRKTRQSIFLEQYPNVKCVDGIVAFCPKMISTNLSCPGHADIDCPDCRREFWSQEVE